MVRRVRRPASLAFEKVGAAAVRQEGAMTWKFRLRALIRSKSGQDLIEYAMLAGFIALGTVVMTTQLSGTLINTFWQNIAGMLSNLPL
jgi:Flp pilus assembly pilin Flp